MKLNEICSKGKSSLRQKDVINDGPYSVYGASGVVGTTSDYQNEIPYVAVVKDGAGVGRANACEPMTSVLGTMQALIPNPNVERDYLLYLVRSLRLGGGFSGSTIPHIYFKDYGKIEVLLPSLEAQKRIVSQLGLIEAQIEQAEAQITQLDQLVKSRFVEMFGDLDSDDSRPLKDVCSIITDGTHQPPKFVDEGIPFLFVSNIASDVVDYETNKFISAEDYEQLIRRTPIEIGDVLVSAVGSFGHPAIVRDGRPFCFQRHIAYLKPRHNLVDSDYLHAALLSDDAQRYMDRCAKGVAQRTVTLKSFKEMKIPVPSMCLQEEFAAFVSQVDKSRFVDLGDEGQVLFLIANRWDEDRQPFHILLVNTCLANSSLGICFKIAFREFGSHLGAQECRNHESLIRMKTHHIRLENRHFWNMRNKHCFTHAANTVDSVNNNVILVDAVTSALAFVAIEPFQRTVVRTFVPE